MIEDRGAEMWATSMIGSVPGLLTICHECDGIDQTLYDLGIN